MGQNQIPRFTDEVIQILEQYNWPGNVRELKNVVERAVYRADKDLIEKIDLNPFINPYLPEESPDRNLGVSVPLDRYRDFIMQTELSFIKRALKKARFSQKKAAESLGLTYDQFRGLYKKYQKHFSDEKVSY